MNLLKKIGTFIQKVLSAWSKDRVPSMAAALAYYTIFSITPLLIICIAIAGQFLGAEAARGQIVDQVSGIVGHETGQQIQTMIKSADHSQKAIIAQIMGLVMLLLGATGVFGEIQSGLNVIWGVQADPNRSWLYLIKDRFLSFSIVLVIAFLLLVSLLLNVVLTLISDYLSGFWGIDTMTLITARGFSFMIEIVLFAMMYKILPDVKIQWRKVWLGAIVASLLFNLGKLLLDLYLTHVDVTSTFGASGSLVVLLIWIYFAAQIFFMGAEITKVFSKKRARPPMQKAVKR